MQAPAGPSEPASGGVPPEKGAAGGPHVQSSVSGGSILSGRGEVKMLESNYQAKAALACDHVPPYDFKAAP